VLAWGLPAWAGALPGAGDPLRRHRLEEGQQLLERGGLVGAIDRREFRRQAVQRLLIDLATNFAR
jgi:hypothetical protein